MLPEYVKFYYDKLPDIKKDVYMQMYKGFRKHNKRIDIKTDPSVISPDDLMYIFECLYNDTPSFYFVDVSKSKWIVLPDGYIFIKDFIYTEEKIKEYDKAILDGLIAFKNRYIREDMTDYEKERIIHNYLVNTITYDHRSISTEEERIKHGEIFNVLGALLRKKAVCWGIACAFKLICDYLKIKCFVVIGNSLPVQEGGARHSWNIVRIDKENYHVDATWDLKRKGSITTSYDYFNLNDNLIRLNHTWSDEIYPPCNSLKYNYFRRNKLYVKTLEQIPDYIVKTISSGKKYIIFKFVNKMPDREKITEKIIAGVSQAGYHKKYKWIINMDTHNVYIELKD